MDDKRIIERAKENLSFKEQLQEQVTACRRLLSENNMACFSVVEGLETLLWAKLRNDSDYQRTMKQINETYQREAEDLSHRTAYSDFERKHILSGIQLKKARQQFREILVFIDKKNLMPYGEEND